jgi:putative tryptophan/tyrosine transport system substrate-binding protein
MKHIVLIFFTLLVHIPVLAKPLVYIARYQPLPAFNQAMDAIATTLAPNYTVQVLDVHPNTIDAVAQTIKKTRPTFTVSIGSKATSLLQTALPRSPIIFSMVFRPQRTKLVKTLDRPGRFATGVALDIPLKLQFSTLRSIFPYMKRIGTLYTPYVDQDYIDQATAVAKTFHFTLIAKPVYAKDQIQPQLESLFKEQIQLFWSTADQRIYSKTSLQYILLSLNRFKVPFMGLSKAYLALGAAVTLDPNPTHIGKKTASMLHRMVQERQHPMITPVVFPDYVNYSINTSVMKQFNFKLSQNILDQAEVLYK